MDTNEKILAWICVTSVRNPWNSKINKSFYSLVLRKDDNDMGVYVRTKCSTDVREQKVHCRDGGEAQLSNILHTKFGRTEVARAISRLSQCGWVEKQETRQLILDDMRFIEAPLNCTALCRATSRTLSAMSRRKLTSIPSARKVNLTQWCASIKVRLTFLTTPGERNNLCSCMKDLLSLGHMEVVVSSREGSATSTIYGSASTRI